MHLAYEVGKASSKSAAQRAHKDPATARPSGRIDAGVLNHVLNEIFDGGRFHIAPSHAVLTCWKEDKWGGD